MITALYASFLGLYLVIISINVIRVRIKHKTGMMPEKIEELERAIRCHGNFIEFTPFVLILMILAELQNVLSTNALHIAGIALVISRLSHSFSLLYAEPSWRTIKFRQLGMVLTFIVILALSCINLYYMLKFGLML